MTILMNLLYAVVFLMFFKVVFTEDANEDSICFHKSCQLLPPNSSSLERDCRESRGLSMKGRCCVLLNDNIDIMGIDLSYCNLTSIDTVFDNTPHVKRINLTNNPDLEIDENTFRGLTQLNMLSLPNHIGCPGTHTWFNVTWQAWNTTEYHHHMNSCNNHTDTCHLLQNYNFSCPIHSECKDDGPGLFKCSCIKGWQGYKCLRKMKGDPSIAIVSSTIGVTVALSACLWFTQRRHVI